MPRCTPALPPAALQLLAADDEAEESRAVHTERRQAEVGTAALSPTVEKVEGGFAAEALTPMKTRGITPSRRSNKL